MKIGLTNVLFWTVIALLVGGFAWAVRGWSAMHIAVVVIIVVVAGPLLTRLTYKIKTLGAPGSQS